MGQNITICVLANKQDLPNAMPASEIRDKMRLGTTDAMQGTPWAVFSTCAPTGDGLYEAFDWLAQAIRTSP
jgi:signal recognition particle receptor subunit beta